jgi:hypothetical protein
MSRSNQIPSPPKKKYSGNAGRQGREWQLCSDLDGVVGVEAEQEQPYQGTVQPIETSRGVRWREIGAPITVPWNEIALPTGGGISHHLSVSIPSPRPIGIVATPGVIIRDAACGGLFMTNGSP